MNLYEKLVNYTESDYYPFHMPGHKRREFLDMPSPFCYDITEIDGFDNLHEAEDILARSMDEAAKIYHTLSTYFLVNGSTGGILSAISAVTKPGDTILMARNCHKAVYNAVYLNKLYPSYLYPMIAEKCNIAGSIEVSEVERAFQIKKDIAAVVITSPTYDGVVSDIEAIARVVHFYGSILIVDEAHGAHFPFSKEFPNSAIECDADLVIQSLHKTLPSLTQTALLHRNSKRVSEKQIRKYLSIFQSSSPSYVLMTSIVRCLNFVDSSCERIHNYIKLLNNFYEETKDLKILKIWRPIKSSSLYNIDRTKLIIYADNGETTGTWIYHQLLQDYHIQAEMTTKDYVVCLSSICDTKEGFDRLSKALHQMDQQISSLNFNQSSKYLDILRFKNAKMLSNEVVMIPSEIDGYELDKKELANSEGEVAAEYIYLYPPGIPILVPGERISKAFIEQLTEYKLAGLSLRGMQDRSGTFIEVVHH